MDSSDSVTSGMDVDRHKGVPSPEALYEQGVQLGQ